MKHIWNIKRKYWLKFCYFHQRCMNGTHPQIRIWKFVFFLVFKVQWFFKILTGTISIWLKIFRIHETVKKNQHNNNRIASQTLLFQQRLLLKRYKHISSHMNLCWHFLLLMRPPHTLQDVWSCWKPQYKA